MLIPFDDAEPRIDPSAWVAPNATVVGDAVVGERSSVFYGAVVRADLDRIAIGVESNVQDNVAMHVDAGSPLLIGDRVSIGHGAVVHGCTVEDDCLIGMNATVLNGAVVGAGSLVAAGAVVLEGTVIPPGSLVAGVPAKVRRELSDEERAAVTDNALRYVALSARHAST